MSVVQYKIQVPLKAMSIHNIQSFKRKFEKTNLNILNKFEYQ